MPRTTTKRKVSRAAKVRPTTTDNRQYSGAPIPATKVYRRRMEEFKNCTAECWMLLDETRGTVCYANTYNGRLKASYDPTHYTHPLKPKVVAKKEEAMEEVEDREEWPEWVTPAVRRTRGSK